MSEETSPIDCWDNCDCKYCEEHRNEWLNDEYNQRAIAWVREKERDKINAQVIKEHETT